MVPAVLIAGGVMLVGRAVIITPRRVAQTDRSAADGGTREP